MTVVGLSSAIKYGTKYLAYVLAVLALSAVPVVAGVLVVATGGASLLDLSVGTLSFDRILGGLALVFLGVLVGLAGLFGLAYKLVADATTAGRGGTPSDGATAAEPGEGTATEDRQSGGTSASEEGPSESTPQTGDGATELASRSGGVTPETPGTPSAADGSTAGSNPGEPSTPGGRADGEPTGADVTDHPSAGREESGTAPSSAEESRTAEPDWRESEYVTGRRPEDAEGGTASARGPPDDPDAWQPPDPSDIEASGTDPESGSERTWEDVKDAASTPSGSDQPGADTDGDSAGADPRTAGTDDRGGAPDVVDGDDGPDAAGDAADSSDADDTLAAEGVQSVDVDGDEDPLADRLPDGDS